MLDDTSAPPPEAAPTEAPDAKPEKAANSISSVGRVLGMRDTLRQDRAVANALEPAALTPPKLTPPPDQTPHTDPMQAFGQPAMWLAIFGSLATRQHLTSAVTSAAGVMAATQRLDAEEAKSQYANWKVANENAIKTGKYVQDAYKAAIARIGADARGAAAEVGTLAKAFKDDAMLHVYETQGMDGVVRFVKGRGKQIGAMELGAGEFAGIHAENMAVGEVVAGKVAEKEKALGRPMTKPEKAQLFLDTKAEIKAKEASERTTQTGEAKAKLAGPEIDLTPEAVDMDARIYLVTRQMPAFGLASAGAISRARLRVQNRAAAIAAENGMTLADIISGQATVRADTMSLGQLTKMSDFAISFENTAIKNIGIVKDLMHQGAGTPAGPVVNRWLQAGRVATGDPDVRAFNAAILTAATEYSKVMSGSTGTAASTDSARQEALLMMNQFDSPETLLNVMNNVMLPDMENRKKALLDQREDIQKRISATPAGGGAHALPAPTSEQPPSPGARKAPDGKWYVPDPSRPGKYLEVRGDG